MDKLSLLSSIYKIPYMLTDNRQNFQVFDSLKNQIRQASKWQRNKLQKGGDCHEN